MEHIQNEDYISENGIPDKNLLQSVDNALKMIDLLSSHEDLSIAEITRMMKLGKSTVFRTLYTLIQNNFVKKDQHSRYRLSYKFSTIGRMIEERSELVKIVHPFLQELTALTGETSHLVIWNSDVTVIFIDKVSSPSTIRMDANIGFTAPAHVAATGKILLAYSDDDVKRSYYEKASFSKLTLHTISTRAELEAELEEVRKNGYATLNEESEIGLTCYAAPLFQLNRIIASISLAGPTERMLDHHKSCINIIMAIARKINEQL